MDWNAAKFIKLEFHPCRLSFWRMRFTIVEPLVCLWGLLPPDWLQVGDPIYVNYVNASLSKFNERFKLKPILLNIHFRKWYSLQLWSWHWYSEKCWPSCHSKFSVAIIQMYMILLIINLKYYTVHKNITYI